MSLNLAVFLIIISFLVAKLEINIEGKDGWAKNLPTWTLRNKFIDLLWGGLPLTGYHFWLISTVLAFLHFPFFLGLSWNLNMEFIILALFSFFWIIEDFFWFLLNPHYGLKRFNKLNAYWHYHWTLFFPTSYFKFLIGGLFFLFLSAFV